MFQLMAVGLALVGTGLAFVLARYFGWVSTTLALALAALGPGGLCLCAMFC
jgi:hypothetical protein